MGIYIPKDYTAKKSFPLMVWYGGGEGTDNPNIAKKLVGNSGYICVAVPYHYQDEKTTGGWAGTTWKYYNTMFTKLHQTVPNINSKHRVCSGFSSGGAAILSLIGRSPEFRDYFYAFMPGGAGWNMGGFDKIKGRPMYAYMGEKDSRVGSYDKMKNEAKDSGIDITYLRFKGGHSMPSQHYPEMRKWIEDKVIFRELPQLSATLQKDFKSKKYASAYKAAKEILNIATDDMPVYKEAETIMAKTKPYGEAMTKKILASKARVDQIKKFILEWEGAEFTQPLREKCDAYAKAQLEKILSQKVVSPVYLKRFITYWKGFGIADQATEKLDGLAGSALDKITFSRNNNMSKFKALERFIKEWTPSTKINEAKNFMEEYASLELKEIKEMTGSRQKSKLKSFARYFPGSQAASEAESMLKK
ncbi:MAG: hypothetical protein MK132_02240 [Lentisphaerales bacterium]|nr:hypothetical protein [Lentisphaerales bacterium]